MIIPVPHMAKRRLDGVAAIDGDVAVQDLLQHLCIGNKALPLADQPFEQSLRRSCEDAAHRSDTWGYSNPLNHGRAPKPSSPASRDFRLAGVADPYPISISASMRSTSPVGKSSRAAARMTPSFLATVPRGSLRRARSSACRTHSAIPGSLRLQLPQQPRGWQASFRAGAPESFRAGAAVTCWSKRAEFMGRGCGRSLIDTGLRSVPLKLSLVMEPHPQDECYARVHATRNGKGGILATKYAR